MRMLTMLRPSRPEVSKLRPAGHSRPAKLFHRAREAMLSVMKK